MSKRAAQYRTINDQKRYDEIVFDGVVASSIIVLFFSFPEPSLITPNARF